MSFFHLFSLIIVLCAALAYINFRFLKLPSAIGIMLASMLFSIVLLFVGKYYPAFKADVVITLESINFSELLLQGMLSFMLFAGAFHIKFADLKAERLTIMLYSTISVLLSTGIVGYASYLILPVFGIQVDLIHALLFGALISPTDPIAVLSILKSAGVSKSLETKIAGESLFNDGVAVVVFLTILELALTPGDISFEFVAQLFAREAIGGLLVGIIFGYVGFKMITSIDNYQVEVLITLAIVMGGYTLAYYAHVSGPLAMVAAGLITGNHSKNLGMSQITEEYVDKFWELIDEILNAILFVLIGLELIVIEIDSTVLTVAILFIFLVLGARYISVYIPSLAIRYKEKITHNTILILTWGGLRGGISMALALSIPTHLHKELWVTITFVIVCFSILVQGLTIGKLTKKLRG